MLSRERVLIGICTCQRPQMLEECLHSLMMQITTPTLQLEIVVVDNDDKAATAREVVRAFQERSPWPLHYVHERRRGIAVARNRVLDLALARGFDWIAFIDDDETAEIDWIAELMSPEYRRVPVLSGKVELVYPEPLPLWAAHREKRLRPEGIRASTSATNNVRFSAELARAGLRFDETLGLMGGEDHQFFTAAHRLGFEIRQTNRAITREYFHPERLTYLAQAYRAYWCGASDVRRSGRALSRLHTIPWNIVFGALELAVSPLFAAAGAFEFKRRALSGGKRIAKGIGRAVALVGYLPQPYRRVVGK